MDLTATEQTVMERFAYKTHIAGGAKAGYVLRRQAIAAAAETGAVAEVDSAIAALVGRGLLITSEGGEFVYLTEAGVESLAGATPVVETPSAEAPAGAPA